MIILALETSCDETSAAVVRKIAPGRFQILSNVVSSQIALHAPYGGVVPEIASRQHLAILQPIVSQALAEAKISLRKLSAIAATYGPGLSSSLLVGLTAAKAIALSLRKPFLAVNHLAGHLWSPFLNLQPPIPSPQTHVALIVSGGHTLLVHVNKSGKPRLLGQTLDDAAGEAFDKVAKLLGLGYPGGPAIDRLAQNGNRDAIRFPRSLLDREDFNFSFSGLKTAVLYHVKHKPAAPASLPVADICASFQEAVVDVLVQKTLRAARARRASLITISGGVACNSRLRQKFFETISRSDAPSIQMRFALPEHCTDNAAMIAAAAFTKIRQSPGRDLSCDVNPNATLA